MLLTFSGVLKGSQGFQGFHFFSRVIQGFRGFGGHPANIITTILICEINNDWVNGKVNDLLCE